MRVGYVRCSSIDQNPARQLEILKQNNCEKIFQDMLSGKDRERPGLKAMLEYVRDNDEVWVESISRLARSTKDLLEIIDELNRKKVMFVSQKENIDTNTPQGKFIFTVFAALSELERSQIKQRQAEGIALAKANGKYKGRPKRIYDMAKFEKLFYKWQSKTITTTFLCNQMGISRATLYRLIKENNDLKSEKSHV